MSEPIEMLCMACSDEKCDFKPTRLQRRPLGLRDVLIEMKFCGVCHSDLHIAANHLAGIGRACTYPCVPGHELAGVCIAVGGEVTKVKPGDQVGVGCIVDSCLECGPCLAGEEQKCKRMVGTYNGTDWSGRAASSPPGLPTYGGYSSRMVVHENFAILIPASMPLQFAGPILCSGITMFDPLKKHGVKAGTRVGIVGLGGLGVMGIKLARALGASVTAISRSKAKEELARRSGAEAFVASSDCKSMAGAAASLDLVLNTIPAMHDWAQYQPLLASGGKHIFLGAHAAMGAAYIAQKLRPGVSLGSSIIGGIANTQEVIDLCARERIYPEIAVVPVQKLNGVYTALDASNDTGERYVLDLGSSLTEEAFDACDAAPPELGPNATAMSYGSIFYHMGRMLISRSR